MNDTVVSMVTLSDKQSRCFDFIVEHRKHYQTLPTMTEIQHGLQYKSRNSAIELVTALKKKGWLKPSYTSVGYMINNTN